MTCYSFLFGFRKIIKIVVEGSKTIMGRSEGRFDGVIFERFDKGSFTASNNGDFVGHFAGVGAVEKTVNLGVE